MASLEKRFALCLRSASINPDPQAIKRCFIDIDGRYRESIRRYHGWRHIERCLDLFDEYSYLADTPRAVELAVWYHDTVYIPGDPGNERESAALAAAHAAEIAVPEPVALATRELILATRHATRPDAPHFVTHRDQSLMLDIDLSILGSDPEEYDEYACNIRAEYRRVETPQFRTGRARILEAFLGADSVYRTAEFATRFQKKATLNMKRELESLA